MFFIFLLQFYTNANTTNSNVVRVAPRPKNQPSNNNINASSTTITTTQAAAAAAAGGGGTATTTAPISTAPYNYNLANSFPATTTFPNNFYPNNSNFPNFTINSMNYTNYTNNIPVAPPPQPATVTGTSCGVAFNPFLAKPNNTNNIGKNSSNGHHTSERKQNVMEKKFNSLKSIGVKKSPKFNSMRVNKCKRHPSSFASNDPQQLLIINNTHSMPYISQQQQQQQFKQNSNKLINQFDQPLYENLTDSIQIHESTMHMDGSSFALSSSMHTDDEYINHHHHCEPESNSIYRSDSGISNSSYECITPVPAPRTNSNQSRKCQSAPVYMNLPNSKGGGHHQYGGKGGSSGKNHHHGGHRSKHSKCKNITPNGSGAFSSYEVNIFFFTK